jgi:hypothetical protein
LTVGALGPTKVPGADGGALEATAVPWADDGCLRLTAGASG